MCSPAAGDRAAELSIRDPVTRRRLDSRFSHLVGDSEAGETGGRAARLSIPGSLKGFIYISYSRS